MNYLKHYCNLIRKAENRTPPEGYTEKHHTFPKSIFGKNNRVVVLTAREHYIAHALLEKAFIKRYGLHHYKTRKMNNAHIMMKSIDKGYCNSYLYENAKVRRSILMKGNGYRLNKNHNEETRRKIGESNKNPSGETRRKMSESKIGSIPWNKGKKNCHSEETRRKISEVHKGKSLTEEHKQILISSRKGKNHTEESKLKMSEALKGEKNHFYGKTHSEESRRKMSEAQSGDKNANSKKWKIKFNNFEEKIISCLFLWAKENGYNPCCLYDISNKRQKTHKNIISVELLTI